MCLRVEWRPCCFAERNRQSAVEKEQKKHAGECQGQFMKERGGLVRVLRLDGFARTTLPRSVPELHELALGECWVHRNHGTATTHPLKKGVLFLKLFRS